MKNKEATEGILYLLQESAPTFDEMGYTFLQIREFLKLNDIKGYFEEGKESWNTLKNLLSEMEKRGLIEERHFDESLGGRVDYSIENPGIEMIEEIRRDLKARGIKLDDKWKLK